jgi:CDP-2,3-bis-(O-geranylgeranyl)-sn-glycerol synthase
MMIWLFLLQCLYFFLPAYVANMAPVLLKGIPFGGKPISEKRFGSHKTWRGLIVAVLMGLLIFWLQKWAYNSGFQKLALIDYSGFPIWFGALLGFGAILGDLVKSYYKRKAGIAPGNSWVPWDQLDFAIGGLIFSFCYWVPSVEAFLVILLLSPLLHLLVKWIGFLLKIDDKRF